jgi:hypothetical protein
MITGMHVLIIIVTLLTGAMFWLNVKLSRMPQVPDASPKPVMLAILKQRTAQQVFDWVIYNLLKQGDQATKGGLCAYRGDKGTKCGAGWCIGDDEYTEEFEGEIWLKLVRYGKVPAQHSNLINDLQRLHDNNPPDKWYDKAIELAQKHILEINFLQSIKPA